MRGAPLPKSSPSFLPPPTFQVHDIKGFWGERPANRRGTAHRTVIVSFLLFWSKRHKGRPLCFNSHSPPGSRCPLGWPPHLEYPGTVGAVASQCWGGGCSVCSALCSEEAHPFQTPRENCGSSHPLLQSTPHI